MGERLPHNRKQKDRDEEEKNLFWQFGPSALESLAPAQGWNPGASKPPRHRGYDRSSMYHPARLACGCARA